MVIAAAEYSHSDRTLAAADVLAGIRATHDAPDSLRSLGAIGSSAAELLEQRGDPRAQRRAGDDPDEVDRRLKWMDLLPW